MPIGNDIRTVFREFNTDGVPTSGVWNPTKKDLRDSLGVAGDEIEASKIAAAASETAAATSEENAQAYAVSAQGFAGVAGAAAGYFQRNDLAQLLADSFIVYDPDEVENVAAGDIITLRNGGAYLVAAEAATDHDIITAGGVKLYFVGYDIRPDDILPNTTPATTDMTAAVNTAAAAAARTGAVLHASPQRMLVSDTITLPPNVAYKAPGGTNYANPTRNAGGKFVSTKTTAGAVISISGTRLQGQGGSTDGLWITSIGAGASTDLTGIALNGIEIDALFTHTFNNLTLDHFNCLSGVKTVSQCNKLTFRDFKFLNGGARVAGATAYSGSIALDIGDAPDSEVENAFIEAFDGTGVAIGANSKVRNSFIDLCIKGILGENGKRGELNNTTVKFSRQNAVQLQDCEEFKINGGQYVGGNTDGAAPNADNAATIRLTTGVTGLEIRGTDFKHLQEWRAPRLPAVLKTGAAGNSATLTGCTFGDVRVGETHFSDANGAWAAGDLIVKDFKLELGSSRALLDTPVAYSSGMTVTSATMTVTHSAQTYVAQGFGVTFPFTTAGAFDADDWLLLDPQSQNGLTIPDNVATNIGNSVINVNDGTTGYWGLYLGSETTVEGIVQTNGLTQLCRGNAGSIGPKFVCSTVPTILVENRQTSGSASIRGFSYKVPVAHTGGGGSENFNLFPAGSTNRFNGRFVISGRQPAATHIYYEADLDWDGTTLTVVDIRKTHAVLGPLAFAVVSGQVVLQASSSTATDFYPTINFDGLYSEL